MNPYSTRKWSLHISITTYYSRCDTMNACPYKTRRRWILVEYNKAKRSDFNDVSVMAGRASFALTLMLMFISIKGDDISSSVQVNAAYDELYADALRLYYQDDWANALIKFEAAIVDWKKERKFTIICRKECKDAFDASREGQKASFALEYLRYLGHMRTCSHACMEKNMGKRLKVSKHTHRRFEDRIPYSFMQFAYHKVRKHFTCYLCQQRWLSGSD